MSNAAVSALQNYLKLAPDEHIVVIMAQMLEFMDQTIAQPSEQVLFALKNFCFILDFYTDYMDKNKMVPKIGTRRKELIINCLLSNRSF